MKISNVLLWAVYGLVTLYMMGAEMVVELTTENQIPSWVKIMSAVNVLFAMTMTVRRLYVYEVEESL